MARRRSAKPLRIVALHRGFAARDVASVRKAERLQRHSLVSAGRGVPSIAPVFCIRRDLDERVADRRAEYL